MVIGRNINGIHIKSGTTAATITFLNFWYYSDKYDIRL